MDMTFSALSQEAGAKMQAEMRRQLLAKAIGEEVLRAVETIRPELLTETVHTWEEELLCEIKSILENRDLGDADCFYAVEDLICAYEARGLTISRRHDFG